jgi:hypothetical protein
MLGELDERGPFVLVGGVWWEEYDDTDPRHKDEPRYRSHWSVCPEAHVNQRDER